MSIIIHICVHVRGSQLLYTICLLLRITTFDYFLLFCNTHLRTWWTQTHVVYVSMSHKSQKYVSIALQTNLRASPSRPKKRKANLSRPKSNCTQVAHNNALPKVYSGNLHTYDSYIRVYNKATHSHRDCLIIAWTSCILHSYTEFRVTPLWFLTLHFMSCLYTCQMYIGIGSYGCIGSHLRASVDFE